MDYETFERTVSKRAGVPQDRATMLIQATLETLSERISGGEADDLAAQLPGPAKDWLKGSPELAESFGADEFIRRVSQRTGVPPQVAKEATRAVFITLRQAVTSGEFDDVMSQLPKEFSEALGSLAAL